MRNRCAGRSQGNPLATRHLVDESIDSRERAEDNRRRSIQPGHTLDAHRGAVGGAARLALLMAAALVIGALSGLLAACGGAACVDLEAEQFSRSCASDSDCAEVAVGRLCAGYDCACGGGAISTSDLPRYQSIFSGIPRGNSTCSCPITGKAACQSGQCVFCPAVYTTTPITFDCSQAVP